MSQYRTERDSMGEVQVPADAYYGAQTQRAIDNFPISGQPLPGELIQAMGLVKFACAAANDQLGKLTGSGRNPLTPEQVTALSQACREVADGKLADQFPIDIYQTGSGTSSNMNVNEVIANRAIELTGGTASAQRSRSTPTTTSTWGRAPTTHSPRRSTWRWPMQIQERLLPALSRLRTCCAQGRAVGPGDQDRPHALDGRHAVAAGPGVRRLRRQIELVVERAPAARMPCSSLPVGGTAVGSGINTHPEFGRRVAKSGSPTATSLCRGGRTTSRPTPNATGWSAATAICARSPRRCSTWPTTSAGWVRARAAVSSKCSCPAASRAARSCPARSTR